MGGHLLVGAVEVGLVAVGAGDGARQVVGDHDAGSATKVREGVHVGGDPVAQLLRGGRLGVGVAARPEHGHEELRAGDHPRLCAGDRQPLAGEVDEELLAGLVLLAHDDVDAPAPAAVVLAVLAVLVARREALLVLHPQQLQGDAGLAQLALDLGEVGHRAARAAGRRGAEEPCLELCVADAVGQRPGEAGRLRAAQMVGHGSVGHAQGGADLAAAQALAEAEPEDLPDLAHGGTGAAHRHRSSKGWKDRSRQDAASGLPHAAATPPFRRR